MKKKYSGICIDIRNGDKIHPAHSIEELKFIGEMLLGRGCPKNIHSIVDKLKKEYEIRGEACFLEDEVIPRSDIDTIIKIHNAINKNKLTVKVLFENKEREMMEIKCEENIEVILSRQKKEKDNDKWKVEFVKEDIEF